MFSYTLTYTVQKRYVKHAQLIELEEYASFLDAHDSIDFPETVWPRSLLYLCDWSYATTSCLDATTGRVYLCRPSFKRSRYSTLLLEASQLGVWLELWVEGDLKDNGQYIKDPTEPDNEPEIAVVPFYTSVDTSEVDNV